jgi:hypothetical protein
VVITNNGWAVGEEGRGGVTVKKNGYDMYLNTIATIDF